MPGAQRTAIGITGNRGELETGTFETLEGVQEVIRVSKPYKLVSRDVKPEDSIIRFPGSEASIGGNEVAVIAGPCGVEHAVTLDDGRYDVVLTASQTHGQILKDENLRAENFLTKPIDREHFHGVVKSLRKFILADVLLPQ